jgi:hypothetical protein
MIVRATTLLILTVHIVKWNDIELQLAPIIISIGALTVVDIIIDCIRRG